MTSVNPSAKTVLELSVVTKRFAGTIALDQVNFTVQRGEIHALLGENGAGKSTLINVVTGAIRPDGGELRVCGQAVLFASPRDAAASGITALPQEVIAAPHLSVGRNVLLGLEGSGASVDKLSANEVGESRMGVTGGWCHVFPNDEGSAIEHVGSSAHADRANNVACRRHRRNG